MDVGDQVDGEEDFAEEILVGMHVFGDNAEHEINGAGHDRALHDFGHIADRFFKFFHIGAVGQGELDRDKDFKVEAKFGAV